MSNRSTLRSLITQLPSPLKSRAAGLFALALLAVTLTCDPIIEAGQVGTSANSGLIDGIDRLSTSEIEARLPNSHPVNYYLYAGRLWKEGSKDQAVFWYYVGQLRFRFLLAAEPDSDPSGGPALFESLQSMIGEPINLYAGSDTKKWVEQINSALEWDASNPNGFTSKSAYPRQLEQVRSGLIKLRDDIVAHAEDIQKQRAQQGIGEVGVRNGVYVEERKAKMPTDWPPLESVTPLDKVVGSYKADLRLGHTLFLGEGAKTLRAATFEISKDGADGILFVAKRDEEELVRRTANVREQDGAIMFEGESKPDYMSSGGIHETVYLRVNTAGDLVVQSNWLTQGTYQNKATPVRQLNTFWFRAARISGQ